MINHAQDDWDDSLIMKVFHDSIKRHKTVGNKERAEQEENNEPIRIPPASKVSKRKQIDSVEEDETCQKKIKYESTDTTDQLNTENIPNNTSSCAHNSEPPQYFLPTYITKEMLDEAQQAMLMAWYQSGYTTGRYQVLCELAEQGYNIPSCPPNGNAST